MCAVPSLKNEEILRTLGVEGLVVLPAKNAISRSERLQEIVHSSECCKMAGPKYLKIYTPELTQKLSPLNT